MEGEINRMCNGKCILRDRATPLIVLGFIHVSGSRFRPHVNTAVEPGETTMAGAIDNRMCNDKRIGETEPRP